MYKHSNTIWRAERVDMIEQLVEGRVVLFRDLINDEQ